MLPIYVAVGIQLDNSPQMNAGLRGSVNANKASKKQNNDETDSQVALTCCQGVSAMETKTEAGNSTFSLKILQKKKMRKSTTQGDIME